ncbi:methyltransferase domain-containing protein [Streptomyces alkaliphilus]|uniref:Methyltransferase domain-containing protein n=1 Tax=Streptomyces alkaliphilus TaxID=1472722 RepID=A0A7W3Y2W5_9ACTN|nr:class I SAM-dependent methyltransferase [Streptomyces alkaliphilus]MBB0246204.1 methyltransferase domain-containing protein [Streptomyces alkaliphilus]
MGVSGRTAGMWVGRWERQQQRYAVDREERFTVISDVVEHLCTGRDRPLLLDLGCGPGSLSARLARRLPGAEIVAVDADPLLLELARAHHADAARYVNSVIGRDGWVEALAPGRAPDVAVSTTALHYLPVPVLLRTYRDLAALLRPGGALINGDHFPPEERSCSDLTALVGRRRVERAGGPAAEDWEAWWKAAAADPELAELFERREGSRPSFDAQEGEGNRDLSVRHHTELLHRAGFRHVTPVWQVGDSVVLVALKD